MGLWKFSVGNVLQRAPRTPTAGGSSAEHSIYKFSAWGDGFSDVPGGWAHLAAGTYVANFDLNLIPFSTDRADAPYGLADLPNLLAGTPGLPGTPPQFGSFQGRANTFYLQRSSYVDVLVMPGETMNLTCGLYGNVNVVVMDLASGKTWTTGAPGSWGTGLTASQAAASWADKSEAIPADSKRLAPSLYRIIFEVVSGDVYVSDPALFPSINCFGMVGHNAPLTVSTATFKDESTTVTWTLTPAAPTFAYVATSAAAYRKWILTMTAPSARAALMGGPLAGEVWVGTAKDFTTCPLLGVQVSWEDLGRISVEGARGRQNVWTDMDMPLRALRLGFGGTNAGYLQHRDELFQGSRAGASPVLLLGDSYETGMTVFGRLDPKPIYTRRAVNRVEWQSIVAEEPRWSHGSMVTATL